MSIRSRKWHPARSVKRWRSCRTLIIDEVSMLNSATFAFAEEFARVMRNSAKPFGGMQVVTCGDFFQLPPVARDGAVSFAFEADTWNTVFGPQNTIELKQVHFCRAFAWFCLQISRGNLRHFVKKIQSSFLC